MLQAVLDNRLQQHVGHKRFQRRVVDVLHNFQIFAAEPRHFDVQIIVDELQFLAERHKRFVLAQQSAQNVAQLQHHAASRVRVETNQRGHRIQRVEKKVRIDLPRQRVHARLQQELLVALELHFVARVVPDFQRCGHRHQRSNHRKHQPPVPLRMNGEQPFWFRRQHERDTSHFQPHAGRERGHLPGQFGLPQQAHGGLGNVQKSERPEIPKIFFVRNGLADQPAQQARRR